MYLQYTRNQKLGRQCLFVSWVALPPFLPYTTSKVSFCDVNVFQQQLYRPKLKHNYLNCLAKVQQIEWHMYFTETLLVEIKQISKSEVWFAVF